MISSFESQSIIFIRDEIRDHLSKFFLYLTRIFTFISLLSLLCSPRANWIQAIYSFEPRFNQIRAASQPEHLPIPQVITLAKSLRSQSTPRSRKPLPLQMAPQPELNERNSGLEKVSWDEDQEMRTRQSHR
jgi:hypothetical protein